LFSIDDLLKNYVQLHLHVQAGGKTSWGRKIQLPFKTEIAGTRELSKCDIKVYLSN